MEYIAHSHHTVPLKLRLHIFTHTYICIYISNFNHLPLVRTEREREERGREKSSTVRTGQQEKYLSWVTRTVRNVRGPNLT